ncbi:MAG: L-histidine N(alpha)-methyltransferase [Rubrivivax sp.]|nr:L-histidine N(alpha)-methyltransferase [Rubrivivax sp.]
MKTPQLIELDTLSEATLAAEAAAGLRASPAAVAPKFFYDALGSRLFDAITELPEYYPTRTEAAIFAANGAAIADAALACSGAAPVLVDLGAGNCAKAARLLPVLQPRRYVAVDISVAFLHQALQQLQREHPALELAGVGQDFSAKLALPPPLLAGGGVLVFYPGSSIGNFAPAEALRLLREARALARGGAAGGTAGGTAGSGAGGLIVGADLVKDARVLEAAYDDALGVTAAFDLNVLRRLNALIGADFDPAQWRHVARFDAAHSRIEMHLEARVALAVRWSGHDGRVPAGERRFERGERIHTENSYKWRPQDFEALLREAGYGAVRRFSDAQGWFGVFVARA